MKKPIHANMIILLFLCVAIYGQNIPRSQDEIPVFPGSVRNLEAQKQAFKDYKEISTGESLRDLQVSVYSAKTVPDEVCQFYIEKLGANEGFPEVNSDAQDQEMNTSPWYEVGYFDQSWFEDQYEGNIKIQDGKWLKEALSKRKQWKQGEWLQSAYFEWTVMLDNGDLVRHFVDILDDNSYDSRAKTVNNKTMITIGSQIEKSEEEIEEY
jgi:hypothetical protein